MKVKVEGHRYTVREFESGSEVQVLQFIHKEPTTTSGELVTTSDGTTNEEVLAVLINRLEYLDSKFPCFENRAAANKLHEALFWLNKRTAARNVEGKHSK